LKKLYYKKHKQFVCVFKLKGQARACPWGYDFKKLAKQSISSGVRVLFVFLLLDKLVKKLTTFALSV